MKRRIVSVALVLSLFGYLDFVSAQPGLENPPRNQVELENKQQADLEQYRASKKGDLSKAEIAKRIEDATEKYRNTPNNLETVKIVANHYGNNLGGLISGSAGFVALCFVVLLIYFLPTMIAANRKHKNTAPILITNLIFGWTFLGWIVCLIWCATSNVEQKNA